MLVWWMCLLRFAQTVNSWRNVTEWLIYVCKFEKYVGRKLLKTVQTMTTFRNPLADPLGTRRGPPLVRGPQFENRCYRLQKHIEKWQTNTCCIRCLFQRRLRAGGHWTLQASARNTSCSVPRIHRKTSLPLMSFEFSQAAANTIHRRINRRRKRAPTWTIAMVLTRKRWRTNISKHFDQLIYTWITEGTSED